MPAQLNIDKGGQAQLNWIDDRGDTDAAAPAGAQVSYTVDNPAVATVDATSGQITGVAEGDANLSANITGADGGPLLEPDGVTPFSVTPAPFAVVAGAAASAGLEVVAAS